MDGHARPGDLVCGLPNFDWTLRPELRDCEPSDIVAAEGGEAGFFVAGAPASRFAYPCRLEDVRYVVTSRVHLLGLFRFPGVALLFLRMERGGWPLVYDGRTFKVYENPRFGARPDPSVRILRDPQMEHLAWMQAVRARRPNLAAFAAARLAGLNSDAPGAALGTQGAVP